MQPRQVYLQTQNAHGAWVAPTTARGARFEFPLTKATLAQLKACPANARLVYCDTGETAATKHTIEQVRARLAHTFVAPAEAAPKVRPLCLKNRGVMAPVVIPEPKNHIKSWWAGTISPNRTHISGPMIVATQDARFVPPKKRA
jgi:hypothetical protein